jgi:hypothetical protein
VVGVAAVVDVEHVDLAAVLDDAVADPVFAPPGPPQPLERLAQRRASPGVTLIVTISYKAATMCETGPELSLGQARYQSSSLIDVVLSSFSGRFRDNKATWIKGFAARALPDPARHTDDL